MADDPVDQLRRDLADLRRELHTLGLDSATTRAKLDAIERDLDQLQPRFVTVERFALVEKIVYSAVGLILLSFLSAVIALVVIRP